MTNLTSKKTTYPPNRQDPTKPEIYFINEKQYQKTCEFYSELFQYFKAISEGYNLLNVGSVTADAMHKLCDNDFSDIKQKVYDDIDLNLKKTGVTNQKVLENLRKDTDQPFLMWKMKSELNFGQINRLRQMNPGIEFDVNVYSFDNGIIGFNDKDRQRIKAEKCTVYIDSDLKRQFLQLSEKTLEDLQALKTNYGISNIFGMEGLFNENDTEGIILNKSILGQIKK